MGAPALQNTARGRAGGLLIMALQVWVFTDGRLGHLNQLRGLVERLASKADTHVCYFNLAEQRFRYRGKMWLQRALGAQAMPDLILGAGRRCHLPMLWAGWQTGAKTVVLMKPSLPLRLFSGACIPAHDNPPLRDGILVTKGVMNNIVPRVDGRDASRGLMLLGGINRHFAWDDLAVVEQVVDIAAASPDITWRLSDSPRTPTSCLPLLQKMLLERGLGNVDITPYRNTGPGWLQGQLAEVGRVWVSCDSVSMVFEAITSGASTGLIDLPPLRDSRVCRSMAGVVNAGLAPSWQGPNTLLPEPGLRLWEADRAADWILARL